MSKYDELKRSYSHVSAEEKLAVLRHEMIMPITVIQGYTRLLQKHINSDEDLPNDVSVWIEKVAEAGDSLKEVLEALTGIFGNAS
jgi:signal transduction histidine kinase